MELSFRLNARSKIAFKDNTHFIQIVSSTDGFCFVNALLFLARLKPVDVEQFYADVSARILDVPNNNGLVDGITIHQARVVC